MVEKGDVIRKSPLIYFMVIWKLSAVSLGWLQKCSFILMLVGATCVDAVSHTRVEHHTTETEAGQESQLGFLG